ncbi:MAG: hypothetical protein DDT29_01585 [Dehalococcoidia bacterium]|nr:hypothetical protein [Bacillota bacterium]
MARLHFMGTPIAPTQKEMTLKQRAFIELACVEYVKEERDFLASLMGVKLPSSGSGSVRTAAERRKVYPSHRQ